jgi:hypothetical protein
MPRYYLDLTRGSENLPNDHEPQEFPDLAAAEQEAIESLREISDIASREGRRTDYDGIDVLGEDRRLLRRVSTSEALTH